MKVIEQLLIQILVIHNNIKNNNMIEDIESNVHISINYDENAFEERIFREVPSTADSNLNEID
tara:strand:+ start:404 stop:592 length:189 start_codon:yes stop_codon:yes gene_type:complete